MGSLILAHEAHYCLAQLRFDLFFFLFIKKKKEEEMVGFFFFFWKRGERICGSHFDEFVSQIKWRDVLLMFGVKVGFCFRSEREIYLGYKSRKKSKVRKNRGSK